jgi:hypothetical protein
MTTNHRSSSPIVLRESRATGKALAILAFGLAVAGTLRGADADANQMLAQAKAKQLHAQQLRDAAAAAVQKAADDEMEAGAEDRDARILTARALQMLKADGNKQRAFDLRHAAHVRWNQSHRMLIESRNAEQKAAQESRNASELEKAAAQIKDQPNLASTLQADAKAQSEQAQQNAQLASKQKAEGEQLQERGNADWAEAEKLDPETARQLAPPKPKPVLAAQHQVK